MKGYVGNTIDESGELEIVTDSDDVYEIGNADQIHEMISDEQMEELAALIVDKMLNSASLKKELAKQQDSRSRERRGERSRYREHPISLVSLRMEDLIDLESKPLELGHNAKFAEDYLNVIRLIYSELEADLGISFFDEKEISTQEKLILTYELSGGKISCFLYRIERFLIVLAYSSTPAYIFDNENKEDLEKESFDQVKSRITALGSELLYFFDLIYIIRELRDGRYLSTNIQLFLKFMDEYKYHASSHRGRGCDLIKTSIHFKPLNELNYILADLKKAMLNGSFQLEPSLNHRQYSRRVPRDNYFRGQSTKDIRIALGKYSKKINKVKQYFQAYKSISVTLYRMRIWLDVDSEKQVELQAFKDFFSELNKKASKSEVGFKGYLNYFYIWDVDCDQWFQDIVLIMDSETLLNVDELGSQRGIRYITQEFEAYANELLNHRANEIFTNQEIPKLIIQPTPLMKSLNLEAQFLMEVKDREAWKVFENNILPLFIYHEMLELNSDDEVGARFSSGRRKIE